ncbi:MAG: O-methyltransferase [Bacteroidetes bacterium]|nr:O-methyltransferase [Bacteroidota bacterium]
MDFINQTIQDYHTHANILQPRMLSGHFQGRFLSMISHMIKPKYVLEIGTYTGYSAICLAEGLQEGGKLITIDVNAELEDLVNYHISQSNLNDKIEHLIGDASEIINTLNFPFDLVFIDADKPNYPKYYDLVVNKIPNGSFILIDNVLWSGKVVVEKDLAKDKDTQILHSLNRAIQKDERVENILLPIRDGLMLVRKL